VIAVARETGLVVGQAVSLECSLETLQTLADPLPPAECYASDGLGVYAELVWPEGGQHVLSVGKADTHTVESLNANLRTYLARLAHTSRCFSRSLEALRRAVRLFVYHSHRRQSVYLAPPSYRGRLPLLF
jgi:IS1 family transposase